MPTVNSVHMRYKLIATTQTGCELV